MPLILLVEDNASLQDTLRAALVEEGHSVITAPHGAAALEILEHSHPDLILLNLYMPIMDGRQFVPVYREKPGPHAPILLMTGAGYGAQRAAALEVAGHLDKPFDLTKLYAKVQQLTSAPHPST